MVMSHVIQAFWLLPLVGAVRAAREAVRQELDTERPRLQVMKLNSLQPHVSLVALKVL